MSACVLCSCAPLLKHKVPIFLSLRPNRSTSQQCCPSPTCHQKFAWPSTISCCNPHSPKPHASTTLTEILWTMDGFRPIARVSPTAGFVKRKTLSGYTTCKDRSTTCTTLMTSSSSQAAVVFLGPNSWLWRGRMQMPGSCHQSSTTTCTTSSTTACRA